MQNILVIKHGALGDIFMSLPPMQAIREKHPEDNIVLLTTAQYAQMLAYAPFFDEVWVDKKPKLWHLKDMKALKDRLRSKKFAFVYDLQTSERSSSYFKLMGKPKHWSGVAKGCSHNCDSEDRAAKHTAVRQLEQLKMCDITYEYKHDLSWINSDLEDLPDIEQPYAIIIAGGSAHRPEKRWPKEHFAALCRRLNKEGINPVLIGTGAERQELAYIASNADGCVNLCGKTGLFDLIELARNARFAVGNDTGPMHMIAATLCRSIVLFSNASDPRLCAPLGEHVTVLQKETLADLPLGDVESVLDLTTTEAHEKAEQITEKKVDVKDDTTSNT